MLVHEPLLAGGQLLVVAAVLRCYLSAHDFLPLLAVAAVRAAGDHWHLLIRGGAVVRCRPLFAHLMLGQPFLVEIQL